MSIIHNEINNIDDFIELMDDNFNVPGGPTLDEIRLEFEHRMDEEAELDAESDLFFRSVERDMRSLHEEDEEDRLETFLKSAY